MYQSTDSDLSCFVLDSRLSAAAAAAVYARARVEIIRKKREEPTERWKVSRAHAEYNRLRTDSTEYGVCVFVLVRASVYALRISFCLSLFLFGSVKTVLSIFFAYIFVHDCERKE